MIPEQYEQYIVLQVHLCLITQSKKKKDVIFSFCLHSEFYICNLFLIYNFIFNLAFQTEGKLYLILDFLKGGDLFTRLSKEVSIFILLYSNLIKLQKCT